MALIASLFIVFLFVQKGQPRHPDCTYKQRSELEFIKTTLKEQLKCCKQEEEFYGDGEFGYSEVFGRSDLHRLWYHRVCYQRSIGLNKVHVSAIIKHRDLKESLGTGVLQVAAKKLKTAYKICGCDQAGHIIPREFGGHGDEYNLFPQNGNLNMGLWKKATGKIKKFLELESPEDDDPRFVTMTIAFVYNDPEYANRPSGFEYHFQFSNIEVIEEIYGYFENEDHTGAQLHSCAIDDTTALNFVIDVNNDFYARRSCKISPGFSDNYYPTTTSSPFTIN